jgi:BlaI family penicillinase repressor
MPESKQFTELQLAILRVLWKQREATVTEVQTALLPDRNLALTTIATILTRLEKEEIVAHRSEGRTYIYRPLVSEQDARSGMVGDMVGKLFGGDSTALVAHLLHESAISADEIARVKAMISEWEQEHNNAE